MTDSLVDRMMKQQPVEAAFGLVGQRLREQYQSDYEQDPVAFEMALLALEGTSNDENALVTPEFVALARRQIGHWAARGRHSVSNTKSATGRALADIMIDTVVSSVAHDGFLDGMTFLQASSTFSVIMRGAASLASGFVVAFDIGWEPLRELRDEPATRVTH